MFAPDETSFGPERLITRSADDVSAPSWEFNSWLDNWYDAKGIFNEEFGVFSSQTILFKLHAYVSIRTRSIRLLKLMWFLASKRRWTPIFHPRLLELRIEDEYALSDLSNQYRD